MPAGARIVQRIDCGGLNADAVDALLAERREGKPADRLAMLYGVSTATVRQIVAAAEADRRERKCPAETGGPSQVDCQGTAPDGSHHKREGQAWTAAEIQTLRDGYALGETPSYIAMDIQRSAAAVRTKAAELGLQHGPATSTRACMTCGAGFESTGPGHRMCQRCRRAAAESPADTVTDGCRHVSGGR